MAHRLNGGAQFRTRLTLRPGQNGTKKLMHKYGERLLAVRYHYDPSQRRRLKTVELIEEELPWDPPLRAGLPADAQVAVRVAWEETELRRLVKGADGKWDAKRKVWLLPYAAVKALNLESRMLDEASTGTYLPVNT